MSDSYNESIGSSSGGSASNNQSTMVPSTPSWMTDQRQRRQHRRGYGRRYSGVGLGNNGNNSSSGRSSVGGGGIHGTASRNHQRRNPRRDTSSSHFGIAATATGSLSSATASTLDFDDDDDDDGQQQQYFLPNSSTVKVQGGRPPRPSSSQQTDNATATTTTGLDLRDEFEQSMSKPKKNRPNNNMPRPLLPPMQPSSRSRAVATTTAVNVAKANGSSSSSAPSFKFATPAATTATSKSSRVDWSSFEFEAELINNAQFTSQQQHSTNMSDTPMIATMDTADISQQPRRMAMMPTTSSHMEENVHPNDTIGNNSSGSSSSVVKKSGARRSSRIGQLKAREANNAQHANNGVAIGLSSSLSSSSSSSFAESTNNNRLNSKKRSATEPSTTTWEQPQLDQQQPKMTVTRSATMLSSFSSGMFSKSTTPANIGKCGRSESFSSLAQRCSTSQSTWAIASNSSSGTSRVENQECQRSNSMACIQDNNNNYYGFSSNHALQTPSAPTTTTNRPVMCHRSISCGNVLSEMKSSTTSLHSPSLLVSSPELFQQLQQSQRVSDGGGGGGGTTLSTPTAVSSASSSRKRRSMDFTSSSTPLFDEFDVVGGCGGGGGGGGGSAYNNEQRTRSRKSSPSSPTNTQVMLHHDDVSVTAPTTTSSVERAVLSMNFFSPLPLPFMPAARTTTATAFGCIDATTATTTTMQVDKTLEDVRDKLNDVSMMSARSDDDDDDENSTNTSTSDDDSDNNDADEEEEGTPREMTDAQVFESKSSYDDFKFLTKSLQKWSQQSSQGKGVASMGLNNGCLIAVPPNWTFEHRATFSKWVATSFGFRVGSVGGTGGSFLRCSDAEGKAVLDRLLRILNDYKNNRLVLSSTTNEIRTALPKECKVNESKEAKPKARLAIKLSTTRPACFKDGPSPFCDGLVEDLLTDDMKGISLDERKPSKSHHSVPQFIRSMNLQPLANKIKNTTLPCFRSPIGDNARRSSGGRRLLRLSSESAINGSDFSNQLHCLGASPSPLPNHRFPGKRIREHASRALHPPHRPSLQKLRSSFERPNHPQPACSKLFESPHPRNSCQTHEAPSTCLENVMETPMPKQVEHWGSRPISGKDWGESMCCCDGTIDACSRIFAKSWNTSEFCDNEELSSEYHITLDDAEQSFIAMYATDLNNEHDEYDCEIACINSESLHDNCSTKPTSKRIAFARCDSVGASAFDLLHLDDDKQIDYGKPRGQNRRRNMKLRKYARMSLFIAAAPDFQPPNLKRCYRLSETPTKKWSPSKETPFSCITESAVFSHVLSFLNEGDLVHSVSLVSTRFADVAAEALGNLMLVSVGCDPSKRRAQRLSNESEYSDLSDLHVHLGQSSLATSMEKGWQCLMHQFPWAQFLSDGAFKRVYKVWNNYCGAYEAMSVMDVDAIDDMGNLNLVGTELSVSVILSSLTKRNICPNFVVTRGVFTCRHEPPAALWGCKDDCAPGGLIYDEHAHPLNDHMPPPGKCGNYQYIRMELCDNGDVEEFIRNHPDKMLTPWDCRNMLFQMAFALHVAADRFGLKHYDVKLLNFLLQSATDPTIAVGDHPHVVLRYGVGSHIFRLRMHPSAANIAKLADYGTAVMRSDTDGQPISLGQFTTLENTPPDFLILGNAAEQGYGHDSFGLGLSMLHLFTGHCPYEEILDEVVCPENLKGKLRSIWKQKSHNVIHSVMMDNNGIEDPTLYDTLYRYLVLFDIPENQFDIKKNGKVWQAIKSTLIPTTGRRMTRNGTDSDVYSRDRKKYSLSEGTDQRIADARRRLLELDGAMELLLSLVSFDPRTRATPLDVINSRLMAELIEDENLIYCEGDIVKSYTAYLTK